MSLSSQHKKFVDEYLLDFNATRAAIAAGYAEKSARQQGSRLLTNAAIQNAIKERAEARTKRTEIKQDQIVERLAAIGFADIRDIVRWDEFGSVLLKPSDALTDQAAWAITEMAEGRDGRLKIKRADPLKALEMLARHLGMFREEGKGAPKPAELRPDNVHLLWSSARRKRQAG